MKEKSQNIVTDLKALDAHVIAPSEYDDLPELTDEMMARADEYHGTKLVRRGRPFSAVKKRMISVRLDQDIIDAIKLQGAGWQTRMNTMLRQTLNL